MLNMFLTGYKILFDGYLTIGLFFSKTPLIIKHFLFDGYLTMVVNNPIFLCNRHVTGRWFLGAKSLKTSSPLYPSYITELRFRQ